MGQPLTVLVLEDSTVASLPSIPSSCLITSPVRYEASTDTARTNNASNLLNSRLIACSIWTRPKIRLRRVQARVRNRHPSECNLGKVCFVRGVEAWRAYGQLSGDRNDFDFRGARISLSCWSGPQSWASLAIIAKWGFRSNNCRSALHCPRENPSAIHDESCLLLTPIGAQPLSGKASTSYRVGAGSVFG
jgi:hypothetical protein